MKTDRTKQDTKKQVKQKVLRVRVDESMMSAVKEVSKTRGVTVSRFMRGVIRGAVRGKVTG